MDQAVNRLRTNLETRFSKMERELVDTSILAALQASGARIESIVVSFLQRTLRITQENSQASVGCGFVGIRLNHSRSRFCQVEWTGRAGRQATRCALGPSLDPVTSPEPHAGHPTSHVTASPTPSPMPPPPPMAPRPPLPQELCDLVSEGLDHAQRDVGDACLRQRMAVRTICDGVSELVAREFDHELEQHQGRMSKRMSEVRALMQDKVGSMRTAGECQPTLENLDGNR